MDCSIGIGLIDDKLIKIKMGPQVRLAYMHGSDTDKYGDIDIKELGIGLAPVLMADVVLNDVASLGMELGYRYNCYYDIEDLKFPRFYRDRSV